MSREKYSVARDTLLNTLNILGVNKKRIPSYILNEENQEFVDSLSEIIDTYSLIWFEYWPKDFDKDNYEKMFYSLDIIIKRICKLHNNSSAFQIEQAGYMKSIKYIINKVLSLNLVNPEGYNENDLTLLYFRSNAILAAVLNEISGLNDNELMTLVSEYDENKLKALKKYLHNVPYTTLLMALSDSDNNDDWNIFDDSQININSLYKKVIDKISTLSTNKQTEDEKIECKFARKLKLNNAFAPLSNDRPCI